MSVGILNNINGSISTKVLTSNIKNNYPFPNNMEVLVGECETPQQQELINTGSDIVNILKIAEFGMSGMGMNAQRCARSLSTRIEESILAAEEKAIRRGNTLRLQYTTLLPTGTSSTVGVIAANVARNKGLDPLVFSVIPNNLSQTYQLINTINALALCPFSPLIVIDEEYTQMFPEDLKNRARIAAGGEPSKFYLAAEFSLDFSCKLARLISGKSAKNPDENDIEDQDDLAFLDNEDEFLRNQSGELATVFSGRQEMFVLHYARSRNGNFEELSRLKPSIMPDCPSDPVVFAEYDSSALSEDEVCNAIRNSLENQYLHLERCFLTASDHNEVIALIPTKIPARLKNLIRFVKKNKSLDEIMKKWAKKTILSNIPPIRRGYENKILKDRLGQIFYDDKDEVDDLAKRIGSSMDLDELKQRNFLFYLAEHENLFLKPIGGDE